MTESNVTLLTSNVQSIAQRGETILTLTAASVAAHEFGSDWLFALSAAMHATLLAKNGVGIAAPQVYVSKRIIIVASRPNPRYPDAPEMHPVVMINPEIIWASAQRCAGEEGCLSVAEQRGMVERAASIFVRYFDLNGNVIESKFEGFPARIVQHELDHLNGILFVQRLSAS